MRHWWHKGIFPMKARMTVEDLAIIVQEGFQGFEQRMNKRFDALENRLERIELRLDQCAYRFELVELQHRVGTIERQIGMKQ